MKTRLLAKPTAAMAVAPSAPTTTWLTKLSTSISTNSRLTGTAIRAISRRGDGAPPAGRPDCPDRAAGSGSHRRSAEPAVLLGAEARGDGIGDVLHGQEAARVGSPVAPPCSWDGPPARQG